MLKNILFYYLNLLYYLLQKVELPKNLVNLTFGFSFNCKVKLPNSLVNLTLVVVLIKKLNYLKIC